MLCYHQFYSLMQLLFFNLCAYNRILSLDILLLKALKKQRQAEDIWGHSSFWVPWIHLSCSSALFSKVNMTDI